MNSCLPYYSPHRNASMPGITTDQTWRKQSNVHGIFGILSEFCQFECRWLRVCLNAVRCRQDSGPFLLSISTSIEHIHSFLCGLCSKIVWKGKHRLNRAICCFRLYFSYRRHDFQPTLLAGSTMLEAREQKQQHQQQYHHHHPSIMSTLSYSRSTKKREANAKRYQRIEWRLKHAREYGVCVSAHGFARLNICIATVVKRKCAIE